MIWGSGGSKSRVAKAAGAEPAGQMRDEKLHAVVAWSTFTGQNVQNTSASDHFWKLRCRKSARRCGAKHICKWKSQKHLTFGPLLEVAMSKKCTPLWREAHVEVKMHKTPGVRTTFGSSDVEKVHAVVARSTFRSQNVKNTRGSDHFWKFRCRFAWQAQGIVHLVKMSKTWRFCRIFNYNYHYTTLHSNTLHYTTTTNTPSLHSTTLHSTTLHCTQLHSTTLHYTALHHTTLHNTTLHYLPLHFTTLHYTTLHYTTTTTTQLHSTTLHYTKLYHTTLHYTNYTPLHYTTLHDTTIHYTSLHYTTLHSTTLQLQLHNYTPLHSITLHYSPLHYTTLHYTTRPSTTLYYITLHYTPLHDNYSYNYNYTPLHSTTLNYTILHYTTLHYIPLHYITLNDTAPQIDR